MIAIGPLINVTYVANLEEVCLKVVCLKHSFKSFPKETHMKLVHILSILYKWGTEM